MKKVLLVQPSLQPPGGSKGVAVWMIEAVKQQHQVSVLTWTPVDFDPINRHYGTSLSALDVTLHEVHPIVRHLIDLVPGPTGLLKTSFLLRLCKKMKYRYDVIITANNEADFGRKGIQYIHFPRADRFRPATSLRWYPLFPVLISAYYAICRRISGFSFERMAQNATLVNSDWTATKVTERYGIHATTLYPPVAGPFPEVPWEERQNGFICIGRIAQEKELERVIEIVAAVRSRGLDVHLRITGSQENHRYYRRILQRAQQQGSWIRIEENLSREQLIRLVSMHRYGIHGMAEEHFGIGVAEMVCGGCIVFVPRGGGQVEIVGGDERLLYGSVEEAATKIVRAMSDPELQQSLRHHLTTRREHFSTTRFTTRIRELVRNFAPS